MLEIKTKELVPHPLNEKVYGKESHAELVESIRTLGILEPIAFSRMSINGGDWKMYVLSGIRRLAAARELKLTTVPVREIFVDGLEAERFLIESNRQRVKTKVQRLRECQRLQAIEAKLAADRKKSTEIKAGKTPVGANLRAPSDRGRAIEKAAAFVGFKTRTAEKGLIVLSRADAGDSRAQSMLAEIDREEISIDHAYLELKGPEVEENDQEYDVAFALAALDEANEALATCSRAFSRYLKHRAAIPDSRAEYGAELLAAFKGKVQTILVQLIGGSTEKQN